MTNKIVVQTTCGSEADARRIARHLVELRLAACVAITPGLISTYHWKGAIEEDQECGLVIKTRRDLFASLATELRKVHPYEVPELIATPIVDGFAAYLEWMDSELQPPIELP
ncbi:divalent-cation tolerance protein CutA [Paludibaculum fermentans]|uniref:Divalent-cation tolerance protein CutA n=1 Tax=Paludibaculum fermentans TaxID=1473598 RepID=A0A7S7SPV5_PALFE|nr:divalent-cation tolerance protein CutA [Paludibaculum fermentans]QOY91555.1 divalent-cation tolerance protein CutA [Paludibaculum fermentans]